MGRPKALLRTTDGKTFLGALVDAYRQFGCTEVVAVTSSFVAKQPGGADLSRTCTVAVNDHPERGRLFSVQCGISAMQPADYCFIQNVDTPPADPRLPGALFENRRPAAYVVPTFEGKGGHPILAGRRVLEYLAAHAGPGDNLREVLHGCTRIALPVPFPEVRANINTPEDYEGYLHGPAL